MVPYDKQHIDQAFSDLAAMSDDELEKAIDDAAILVTGKGTLYPKLVKTTAMKTIEISEDVQRV